MLTRTTSLTFNTGHLPTIVEHRALTWLGRLLRRPPPPDVTWRGSSTGFMWTNAATGWEADWVKRGRLAEEWTRFLFLRDAERRADRAIAAHDREARRAKR